MHKFICIEEFNMCTHEIEVESKSIKLCVGEFYKKGVGWRIKFHQPMFLLAKSRPNGTGTTYPV